MFTTFVFAFALLLSHLSVSNCAKLGTTTRPTPTIKSTTTTTTTTTSVDGTSTMSRKAGREGVAYHEDPEGVTAGEVEEDVESKTETTYQRWKEEVNPSQSEEDASWNASWMEGLKDGTIRYKGLHPEFGPMYSYEDSGMII